MRYVGCLAITLSALAGCVSGSPDLTSAEACRAVLPSSVDEIALERGQLPGEPDASAGLALGCIAKGEGDDGVVEIEMFVFRDGETPSSPPAGSSPVAGYLEIPEGADGGLASTDIQADLTTHRIYWSTGQVLIQMRATTADELGDDLPAALSEAARGIQDRLAGS